MWHEKYEKTIGYIERLMKKLENVLSKYNFKFNLIYESWNVAGKALKKAMRNTNSFKNFLKTFFSVFFSLKNMYRSRNLARKFRKTIGYVNRLMEMLEKVLFNIF